MTIALETEAPPLRQGPDDELRVGKSNVLLEIVIHAFQDGATPEAIVQNYDTLHLSDVYAVIAYYLRHRSQVEGYMAEREKQADELWKKITARQGDMSEIRARLLARKRA